MTYPKIRTIFDRESKKRLRAHNWAPVVNLMANGDIVGILNSDIHVVCVTRHMGPLSTRVYAARGLKVRLTECPSVIH